MSLLSHLFNGKGQNRGVHAPSKKSAFLEMDEESLEEELEDEEDTEDIEEEVKSTSEESDEEETYEVLEREIHPAKIICPDCGGITLEGLEFCDKCGGELF